MIGAREAWSGAQFFFNLPSYLRHPMTDTQARKRLHIGLRNREQAFLDKTRLDIFGYPDRPYAQLMRCAGCEYGDIEAAVRRDGLDATLKTLLAAGIYLTIDEFKGRKPARRGSTEIDVQPAMLQAPRASYHLPARSGGSRGKGTPVMIGLGVHSRLRREFGRVPRLSWRGSLDEGCLGISGCWFEIPNGQVRWLW